MREIEALKERGVYDIDLYEQGKELIGLTVDTRRKQFYVIVPSDKIITKDVHDAYKFIEGTIINRIAEEKDKGKLTGEIKSYAEEILVNTLTTLGVTTISEKENQENQEFYEMTRAYNHEEISAQELHSYCCR